MSRDRKRASLAAKFERHADEEGKVLEEYRALSDRLGGSSAGMLVNQILTEEEIHHLLLRTIATWLREHPATQERLIPAGVDREELLRLGRALQEHEREAIDACRGLMSELSREDEEVLCTLLDAMVLDSEKHQRFLRAVEKILTAEC